MNFTVSASRSGEKVLPVRSPCVQTTSAMLCLSTRGQPPVSLSVAIGQGLAPDGGLYIPIETPPVSAKMGPLAAVAYQIIAPYFINENEDLRRICNEAFTFEAPLKPLGNDDYSLELFHGPTAAFKDFGARFLAECLSRLITEPTTILVATSGDTGAAVAAAFHRRPNFKVVILYPDGRVSARQAHQLGAFGDNVRAYRVAGTFDDCQRMVKTAFADKSLTNLGSANSISLGRLLPQMAYYAQAALSLGEVNVVVPTGNLGNALACFLIRRIWGIAYSDLGPFRAIRATSLEVLGMTDRNFGWTVEMQIKAAQKDVRGTEVPVSYRPRIGVSKVSGTIKGTVLAGITILRVIGQSAVRSSLAARAVRKLPR